MKKICFLFCFNFLLLINCFCSPLKSISEQVLENGLTVFVLPDNSNALVRIEFCVKAGFSSQTQQTNGFFKLYSNIINSSTTNFSFASADCKADSTHFVIELPPSQLYEVLDELSKLMFSNQFSNQVQNQFANTNDSIEKIAAEVGVCRNCVLCEKRTNTVPGMGVQNPLVMIIGEGPGFEEDKQGLPFVGPAGQLLDKMLTAINLSRETNCFIANVVKCRPPQNRDPNPEEAKACRGFLERQINILKPKMILLLGRIATYHILDTAQGISTIHGQFFTYKTSFGEIPVMPIYHPSAVLRNEALKRPVWEDLKVFKKKLEEML